MLTQLGGDWRQFGPTVWYGNGALVSVQAHQLIS